MFFPPPKCHHQCLHICATWCIFMSSSTTFFLVETPYVSSAALMYFFLSVPPVAIIYLLFHNVYLPLPFLVILNLLCIPSRFHHLHCPSAHHTHHTIIVLTIVRVLLQWVRKPSPVSSIHYICHSKSLLLSYPSSRVSIYNFSVFPSIHFLYPCFPKSLPTLSSSAVYDTPPFCYPHYPVS